MDSLTLALIFVVALYFINARGQRQRIALLGSQLGHFQIEKLMENLTEGYLRALGEQPGERREQIWSLLRTTERQLSEQFSQFAEDFTRLDAESTRVSRLPVTLPGVDKLLPQSTFDLRQAFAIHANGIAAAALASDASPRDKAFTMSAELFLMQHTCHWFCKSKAVASARLLARHKTAYAQVIASVSPATRNAYLALVRG
jgi:hypothetical protein